MKLKDACSWEKSYNKSRQQIKKQRHYFTDKGPSSWSYGFSSGHVWMWELDPKKAWAPKNWCFWTVVLEKTLESPLDCKIKPVNPKGNQSWIFIIRTDAEVETPTLWSPHANSWLIWKDPDAGKDWRQEKKGITGDEMVGWHHQLNGHESEQALGGSEGQGSLVCCRPWGHKESDLTKWLNKNNNNNPSHLSTFLSVPPKRIKTLVAVIMKGKYNACQSIRCIGNIHFHDDLWWTSLIIGSS